MLSFDDDIRDDQLRPRSLQELPDEHVLDQRLVRKILPNLLLPEKGVLQLGGVEAVEVLLAANFIGLEGHLVGQRLGPVQGHLEKSFKIEISLAKLKSSTNTNSSSKYFYYFSKAPHKASAHKPTGPFTISESQDKEVVDFL